MIERIFNLDTVDAIQIAELGRKFYAATGLRGSFHGDTFVVFWNKLLEGGIASMWVSREDGRITGTIGMTLTMSLMDGIVLADEMFWFVDPNHRGSAGLKLFLEAKKWAKHSGAGRMLMGKMLAIEPEKVGKFYEQQGFKPLQTQYFLDL